MGGSGSLTYQVQESFKTLLNLGRSKREAKKRRQAEILAITGETVPLSRIVLDEIFSVRTAKNYVNLLITFALWCKDRDEIRYVTQIRMAEMGTRYIQERFLSREKPSGWTIRTLLSAMNKFSAAVQRKYGCDIGRVDRQALGVLPPRDKGSKQQAGDYPPEHARAIIEWVGARHSPQAQLAALILEIQWRCGLRISEATGLRTRMIELDPGLLKIRDTNITKGGRNRKVDLPVPRDLLKRLAPLVAAATTCGAEARVFRVHPHYVRWRVRQACHALGIERRGTHGYRYRFVNDRMAERLRKGMAKTAALRETSEEVGHSRPGAVRTYSNLY